MLKANDRDLYAATAILLFAVTLNRMLSPWSFHEYNHVFLQPS
jgi:hypothetical protein